MADAKEASGWLLAKLSTEPLMTGLSAAAHAKNKMLLDWPLNGLQRLHPDLGSDHNAEQAATARRHGAERPSLWPYRQKLRDPLLL